MATKPKKTNVEEMIAQADGEATASESMGDQPQQSDFHPTYRMYTEARVPVSKAAGSLWKSRYDCGVSALKTKNTYEAWDEAIAYYKNDQTGKRNRDNPDMPSSGSAGEIMGGPFASTENIVFANVSALVPSIYAKNPDVSIQSPKGDQDFDFTITAQKLIRTIMQKRTAPGVNLKPKMRRGVVLTTLTNISYMEVGYTRREVAVEGTLAEIDKIAQEYATTTDKKKLQELEGQLQALDDKVDLLQPAGPWTRVLHPKDVIIDPDATLADCSDAKWIMIREVYDTSFINAVYRQKNEEGQWTSVYKPTHVLRASTGNIDIAGHDQDITNFSILKEEDNSPSAYGYDDERSFKRAQRTFVWKVWDRITRRVLMYAENDWSWPIWVWDDPYGLDDFFPIMPLAFHTDPEDMYARGEVSYYLDQQDEINRINSQVSKMRYRISNTLVYNKRLVKDEASLQGLINPVNGKQLVGVDLPEGMKIADVLSAPPVPTVEYAQLFDKRTLFEAADRVSGVSSVVKGVEFRTNTTNKAIDSYESSTATRLDEKIDAIEEQIGRIGYAILHMCLQFMSKDEVTKLIGATNAAAWPGGNMTAKQASEAFTLTVVGGSSLKPTSKVRKEQAKEVGQIIGQFGASNPVALLIVLKMMHRAYSDEIVLDKEDWDLIMKVIEGQVMQQVAPEPAPQAAPQQGAAPEGQQASIDPKAVVAKISEALAKMPEPLRKKVGEEIASGVPLEEVIGKLMQVSEAAKSQPQQQMQ